jgi:tetratricopeptide (TPR) repeat protein
MAGQRRPVRKIAAGLICGLLVVLAATWCLSVWRRRPPAPGSSPKFSSPAVRDGLSQDPLVADRASSRVDDGDAMTSANQVEENAHSAVLAVAAEESDVLQRMAEHFDAGEFQAAMQVYRGWPASDREHGRLHEEAAQLVFQKAMELFETETAAAQPDFDVVQQLLLTLIESNANAVANESETVAADCADARVVLAYLKTMPPRGSTEDINSLQQSVDYLDLYCAKYVEPKPNEHIRYLCARGQIWYALGRNLLAADRIEEAVRAFDRAIQDQWSKQFISEQFSSELHIEMAEVAMLMFSLPEVHQTQSPAAEYAAKARAFADSAGSGQRFLGLLKLPSAVAQFRNGEYRDAERSLLQAQQFEGGDGNLNWLNLAMTVARLDRRQEAREWWARAKESFVQGSTPPTTPLTMSEKLLFHNAEQFFGEGVAGSSQPSQ